MAANGSPLEKGRTSPYLKFFEEMASDPTLKSVTGFNEETGRTRRAEVLIRRWRNLGPEERLK